MRAFANSPRNGAALRVAGQLAVYRAAPELYMQREIMRVLQGLAPMRKFVLGIDPARVNIDVDLVELDAVFQNFNLSSSDEEGGQ